jgi:hypothetical protein
MTRNTETEATRVVKEFCSECERMAEVGTSKGHSIACSVGNQAAKPKTREPLTVETALAELREMFTLKVRGDKRGRRIDVERRQFASSSPRADRLQTQAKVYVEYASGKFSAPLIIEADTLEECMAQVREWRGKSNG